MRLKAFKVQMYRPILDSGWVDVDDITVIVGKNESGKTALLRALHKFNPFNPDPYTLDREWPRGHRKSQSLNEEVVTVRFEFEGDESREIASVITNSEKPTGVEIARTYDGDYKYTLLPDDDVISQLRHETVATLLEELSFSEDASAELKEILSQVREQAAETFEGSGVVALGESIDEYNDSIDSAVQEDTEQDRTDAERAKDALSQVSKLADIGEGRKN